MAVGCGTGRAPVDVSVYPTTASRFSILVMGAIVAGVVEEMAFPRFAYSLAVAPGFFLASVVYGYLALKSGSILPSMAIHFVGDLGFACFALLGGDAALLFAR
jgi:membrane protease YdiL (CAAX protease family)